MMNEYLVVLYAYGEHRRENVKTEEFSARDDDHARSLARDKQTSLTNQSSCGEIWRAEKLFQIAARLF